MERLEREDALFNRNIGYKYKNGENNPTLFEFHVDDHPTFQQHCSNLQFGGHLSVRKKESEKPLILLGQDESIFKQYTLSPKQWSLPDGITAPNPKEDGQGVMLSSFVSRDFGYGHDLTESQLIEVNNYRRGKCYVDEEAAIAVNGKKEKNNLTSSPFVCWLDYGINFEGYWNYHHMIVQLEDIVDVLKTLYKDQYDFIFYFDHSARHDRLRPDGLNSKNVNKYHGGTQATMRNTTISDNTYLGSHDHHSKLQIGMYQSMQYQHGDIGPFYFSPEERERRKNDIESEDTEKNKYSKEQLIKHIQEHTNEKSRLRGTIKDIQAKAKSLGIPIQFKRKKILEGLYNKLKVMLQIL